MPNVSRQVRPPYCVDPDQFLDLSGAVSVGREDVRAAWEKAYALVEQRLAELGTEATLYVVFGLQGAGKSTWVATHSQLQLSPAVYLSGPLPSRKHRERALSIAKRLGCRCIGVWVNVPFDVAYERNSRRSGLARIKEEAMRHVQQHLEPPSIEEGFHEVIEHTSVCGDAYPHDREAYTDAKAEFVRTIVREA
jgi:predicted kinase